MWSTTYYNYVITDSFALKKVLDKSWEVSCNISIDVRKINHIRKNVFEKVEVVHTLDKGTH